MGNNLIIDETDIAKENLDLFNLQSNTLAKRFTSRRIDFYGCTSLEDAQKKVKGLICKAIAQIKNYLKTLDISLHFPTFSLQR